MNEWLGSFVDEIMTFSVFSYCLPLLSTPVDDDNNDVDAVAAATAVDNDNEVLYLLFFVAVVVGGVVFANEFII